MENSNLDRVVRAQEGSVSEVDHPYLHEVIANIDATRVRWKISYYSELDALRQRVDALGLPSELVEYALLSVVA